MTITGHSSQPGGEARREPVHPHSTLQLLASFTKRTRGTGPHESNDSIANTPTPTRFNVRSIARCGDARVDRGADRAAPLGRTVMHDSSFGHETGGNTDVWLHRLTGDAPRRGTIGPRPDHVVFRLTDGIAELTADNGVSSKIAAGQPTMLSASVAYSFSTNATGMSLLHISASFLSTLTPEEHGHKAAEFCATPTDTRRSNRLTALLDEVEERLLNPKLPDAQRMKVNQRIATAVLSTFNQSQADAETRLRRAIRFAHDHAAEPIDVSDIAAAAGLSERGLQHLFRRSLNVTPMRYLREVRLDAAHLELTVQRPTTQTVLIHDVARRWQFFHLGRFAAMYRARFGQSPRESVDHPGRQSTGSR